MSAARAKARKMAARFSRPRQRSLFGPFTVALGYSAIAASSAASGMQGMVKAALDFERAYVDFRQRFVAGIAPDWDALAKLRMERP